jgi:hypothetical protein
MRDTNTKRELSEKLKQFINDLETSDEDTDEKDEDEDNDEDSDEEDSNEEGCDAQDSDDEEDDDGDEEDAKDEDEVRKSPRKRRQKIQATKTSAKKIRTQPKSTGSEHGSIALSIPLPMQKLKRPGVYGGNGRRRSGPKEGGLLMENFCTGSIFYAVVIKPSM